MPSDETKTSNPRDASGAAPETTDLIARGLLGDGVARVVAVVTTEVTREAVARHGTKGLASVALGRAATAGLLLATLTKDDERVTLQLLGTGPMGSLTVDAQSSGRVRVFVKNPLAGATEPLPRPGERASLGDNLGATGQVTVVRDLGLREPFRGQTSFASGEIDDDVERYLIDSEQIDSALTCEVFLDARGEVLFAGGVMVQSLPGSEGSASVEAARLRLRQGALGKALARVQLGGVTLRPEDLGEAATTSPFATSGGHGHAPDDATAGLTWLDRRPVAFFCPCSKERAAGTLALLDEAELTHMLASNEHGHVTCNFCRRNYEFSLDEIDAIRADVRRRAATRS